MSPVAVQVMLLGPTVAVSSGPQVSTARPDRGSAAPDVTVAAPLSSTGLGVTTGASVGAVLSILTVTEALPVLPARLVA